MTDLVVEAAQDLFASVELGHLCAQAGEDGSELAGDITAAHHQQAIRERLDVKDVVGGDGVFAAHEMRYMRRATGGDQDVLGGEGLMTGRTVDVERGQGHTVWTGQAGKRVEHGDTRATQQVAIDAVEAADFLGAVGLEGGPVEPGGRIDFPPEAL